MPSSQPWKNEGMNKPEWVAKEVAKAVKAGKEWELETVDFSDPNRPLTCLEVDFPIVPINQIAAIEAASGAAKKPIYQMSKWWARRQSSIFRSLILAASTLAPEDKSEAAKRVWASYYGNHSQNGAFRRLKVADIFMGGGTTLIEGSRLGMDVFGNDLNPVAWFVSKNEFMLPESDRIKSLLSHIEKQVKPQISPFYACNCPRGHRGKFTNKATGDFTEDIASVASLPPDKRQNYHYNGPELIYVFWAKHGPCQVSGCSHRTPLFSSPVIATKSIAVKFWEHKCPHCGSEYDLEEREARLAPSAPLVVSSQERAHNPLDGVRAVCPSCGKQEDPVPGLLRMKPSRKDVELSILLHPDYLEGSPSRDTGGKSLGGSASDSAQSTILWNQVRAEKAKLIEVRGPLPDEIECPDTGKVFSTGKAGGTIPKKSHFSCGACGTVQDVLQSVKRTETNGPMAMYAIHGYCQECDKNGELNGGRFFAPADDSTSLDSALLEWENRSQTDLLNYFPKSEIPYGFMTGIANGDIRTGHGFTHFWKMFNPRQLLLHALLLKTIDNAPYENREIEFALGAFQQYLRLNNLFSIWHKRNNQISAFFSSANYQSKSTTVETGGFCDKGDGSWKSACRALNPAIDWGNSPWELVSKTNLKTLNEGVAGFVSGKSEKVFTNDPISTTVKLGCESSTDLSSIEAEEFDLVITDPPFGGLMHYSELSDFFYVWLRLLLSKKYPTIFGAEYTPKSLEAVANSARQPGIDESTGRRSADSFYQRLLTGCWEEAFRLLKPGGILAFTFHHSEDAPWVSVLESLFDAGLFLEATYPIRSDETKGTGEFGSKRIEYDIIHVCRKRTEEPLPISWAKMRRQVLHDVRRLQEMLEHHQDEGLPEADMQVIRRGKALEYFSRHYGKVYKNPDTPMTVLEALLGINQLLDEEAGGIKEAPPHNAEPFTRMLLRLFDGTGQLPRDQMQKFLRGTGSAPSDYVNRGWTSEKNKIFYLTPPLEVARNWVGKLRKGLTSDYDQAMFLIGACIEGSGINANETLSNDNFLPHPALGSIVTWFKTHGADSVTRNAASRAQQLYQIWESKNQKKVSQLSLFESLGEEGT